MILMYHHIAQDAGFNTVSEKQFVEQLNFLADNNYQIISLPDYISLLKTKELTARMVCLSFDDAYQSFPDVVLPILTKYKLTASVFVPTGFLGKTNEWDEPISTTQINVVSAAELEQLSKEAFITIGSHGVSHKPLSHLSVDEMTTEIFQSKSLLDTITKKSIRYFSFPYGQFKHFDSQSITLLKEAGYEAALSTNWGRKNTIDNLFFLNRIEIESHDTILSFSKKISCKYHIKYFKQIVKNLV